MDTGKFKFSGGKTIDLGKYKTNAKDIDNPEEIKKGFKRNKSEISEYQNRLYAENKQSLLIILQAMDGGGKDSTIKHVMSGINPQGVDVYSFKQPSQEELSRDYLWRASKIVPQRGKIAIFNRSYYEDVLVVKVHSLYKNLNIIDRCKGPDTVSKRYGHIKNFEGYLWDNGVQIIKLYLHMSKETQLKRFEKRLNKPDKNWKFSESDMEERKYWDAYQKAYKKAIAETATDECPWFIVPADDKWYARAVVSEILLQTLRAMDPKYPKPTEHQKEFIEKLQQYNGLTAYENQEKNES